MGPPLMPPPIDPEPPETWRVVVFWIIAAVLTALTLAYGIRPGW